LIWQSDLLAQFSQPRLHCKTQHGILRLGADVQARLKSGAINDSIFNQAKLTRGKV
jgi:hypothetical protein